MNVPFAKADLASHKRARTHGRISSTFTRKVGLLWTCIRSFCLLRLSSAYAARKDPKNPTLLATRKLCTARRRVQRDLVLDFQSKTITIDEITLPMRNINLLRGSSMLLALKLNNSLAKEPLSPLDATKHVTRIFDAKYAKGDLQSIVKNNCKHLSANHQKKLLQLL
jgi:hypothetical protein